jgi:ADP-ribosylglycohydrolase
MLKRNKIQGMLVGGAIGDAWGMSVEAMSPVAIQKKYPRGVTKYVRPDGHKFFDGFGAGTVTDDTVLTVATMTSILEARTLDMGAMQASHVMALKANPAGWGKTTREALELMSEGTEWLKAGKIIANSGSGDGGTKNSRGYGNGIIMKAGALGAFYATEAGVEYSQSYPGFNQFCVIYASMTHYTKMAAMSGVIHANVVRNCLLSSPEEFDIEYDFLDIVADTAWEWSECKTEDHTRVDLSDLHSNDDNLEDRMLDLWRNRKSISGWTPTKVRTHYGASPYTYQSMPFSYAMFIKNPYSAFQAGHDTVNMGGDSDTNAKIVLELVGSLHGVEIFQTDENRWMVDELPCYDRLMDLADEFCDQFGVK